MKQVAAIFRVLLIAATTSTTIAFTTPQHSLAHLSQDCCTKLHSVIRGEDVDAEILDPGQGGVRLAQESAVKVVGTVKHKPGSAEPKPMELLRYTQTREVSESEVSKFAPDVKVVCVGVGKELYRDPGEGTEKVVILAPLDAVRDAMMGAGSTQEADSVVINLLGGDDLQILEALDAVEQLVINLDVKTNAKISFNSLSHKSFPLEQATLTVVALKKKSEEENGEKLRGSDKSLTEGEIYFQNGKYFTVIEEDITNAVA